MAPAGTSTLADVPQTRWARTVDGACIAYQDIGEGPSRWSSSTAGSPTSRSTGSSRATSASSGDCRGTCASSSSTSGASACRTASRAARTSASCSTTCVPSWTRPAWRGPRSSAGEAQALSSPAFFAATHPDRALCFALVGYLHYRREPDYPEGEQRKSRWIGSTPLPCADWGTRRERGDFCNTDSRTRPRMRRSLSGPRRLARFSATPSPPTRRSSACGSATDVRPALAVDPGPDGCLLRCRRSEDEDGRGRGRSHPRRDQSCPSRRRRR